MTDKEAMQMARDSGMELYGFGKDRAKFVYYLEAFANLAYAAGAAAEREACAKFVEEDYVRQFNEPWRDNLAKAIRARGQE